jgi:hypothetical protein
MIRKTLIAAAALAVLAGAASSQAEAKVHVDVHIGAPGLYIDTGYPVWDADYYDEDPGCGFQWVKHTKWKNGHKKIWYSKEYVCG